MKNFLLKQLQNILKVLARATIVKYQPSVIGITGSVGKTSTKEAVYAVLKNERKVRKTISNFNNEFGLPLTILGEWSEVKGLFFWPKVILKSIWNLVIKADYPEILVLEYGVQKPNDMGYLLEIAKPNIGIMTAIGELPVHVEFFSGPEQVAREKSKLVESLPGVGFAIMNADDAVIAEMKEHMRAHSITFGVGKGSQVKISNIENLSTEEKPIGMSFKLEYAGSIVPVRLLGVFGKTHAYASAAAASVGLVFGMNLVKISEALSKNYVPAKHRMNILPGVKGTFIIDDCYNASPLSMHAAIDTVKGLKAPRKIGILGDMLELGKFSPEAHEEIGRLAGKVFDLLITIGTRGKLIAEGAAKEGGMSAKSISSFDTAEEAKIPVQNLLKTGDLVLIKASRGIGLERIVDEIKAR